MLVAGPRARWRVDYSPTMLRKFFDRKTSKEEIRDYLERTLDIRLSTLDCSDATMLGLTFVFDRLLGFDSIDHACANLRLAEIY